MFDLNNAIREWRQRMLAAGLKSPELLDELESHLRDAVEHSMEEGRVASQAFAESARCLGPETELSQEFETANLQNMKPKLRNILFIIVLLAIGAGLLLPGLANWRDHGVFSLFDFTAVLIGAAMFFFGVVWVTRSIVHVFKKSPKA